MLEALELGGGGYKALARHAVASLLNASNPEVDANFTEADVIALVQQAFDTEDFEDIKDMFADANEQGCTVDTSRDGNRVDRLNGRTRKF